MITDCLIQIGIFKCCEYIYVTQNGWGNRENIVNEIMEDVTLSKQIRRDSPMFYYGVDMCQKSIDYIENRYSSFNNCKFLRRLIYKSDGDIIKHDDLQPDGKIGGNEKETSKSLTLKSFLKAIDHNIKVIVMDVEGSELDILDSYDFSIKPECFVIESHNIYITNRLMDIMRRNGYSLIKRDITNEIYPLEFPTNNLTFILSKLLTNDDIIIDNIVNVSEYISNVV